MSGHPDMERPGWIPPEERDELQMQLTYGYHEEIGTWAAAGPQEVDLPERVLDYELEIAATGKLLLRPYQYSGSCVGCSGMRAYCNAICGDIVLRGDVEELEYPFPWATYGVGRELAGMRGRGEGSFGAAQAKAVQQFGMLEWDYQGLPQPSSSDYWLRYSKAIELQWSHPSGWPIPRSELEPAAREASIEHVTRLTSVGEVLQAKAQAFGVTMASSFGTQRCNVVGDVLLAEWNGSWAHQMSVAGYWQHPTQGLMFAIDNQWGDQHGTCPTLGKLGVRGSFWIRESVMNRILVSGEVYAHTSTRGFQSTSIDWNNLGVKFS